MTGLSAKKIRYFAEFVLLWLFFQLCRALPLDAASALGGWIGRVVGPRLAATRKARRNLTRALPGRTDAEYARIITGMWDNLGRVMAEYPHLAEISETRVAVEGKDQLTILRDDDKPAVVIAAHTGNWEVLLPGLYYAGLHLDAVGRAPNNPWVDKLLARTRSLGGKLTIFGKSARGTRGIVQAMQNGAHVGLLVDQKYNQGLSIPFFGIPAMTSPVYVMLAKKFGCPLVPVHLERTGGAYFHISVFPPILVEGRSDEDVIIESHRFMEDRIRENPEQWLWLHRRWPEEQETPDTRNEDQNHDEDL